MTIQPPPLLQRLPPTWTSNHWSPVGDGRWKPLDEVDAYRGSKEEAFTIDGVQGEGVAALTNDGGGAVSFTCGDYFVVTSLFAYRDTNRDVRTNLIHLAASMTPWVCQGEPIPGMPGNKPVTLEEITENPTAFPTTASPADGASTGAS